jgi:hypothetical protein
MGVFHDDYPRSLGLLDPSQTLWAVLAWLAVAVAGLVGLRYRTLGLLLFGPVFFLVGHALESSVFALELYFEHRNYLPATGLFIGIGIVLGGMLRRLPDVAGALLTATAAAVLLLAPLTASQAAVWSNGFLLHMESVNAHPRSVRANTEYAGYLAGAGYLPQALAFSARAAALDPSLPPAVQAARELVLHCQSNQPLPDGFPRDFEPGRNQLDLRSTGDALQVAVELIENGACPQLDAVALADRFAELFHDDAVTVPSTQVFLVFALLENALGRPAMAARYTGRLIERGARNPQVYLMHLNFAISLGDVTEADAAYAWLAAAETRGELDRQQRDTLHLHLAKSTDF